MSRNTARALLLSSVSALSMFALGAQAQTVAIPGGGASLPSQDYAGPGVATSATPTNPSEEFAFDNANSQYGFQYFYASSGRGQAAFSMDDPAQFKYTGTTPLPTTVKYAASDAFLAGASGTTSNGYTYTTVAGIPGVTATYPLRSTQDGALIQLPMLGIGIAIPGQSGNKAVKTNGSLTLTDNDLCGIFSGVIQNYANISAPLSNLTGAINVYYRADSSGTSFQFTNHLKAVCNSGNSTAAFVTALQSAPLTKFATLFTGYTTDANGNTFVPAGTYANANGGSIGSAALAVALAGSVGTGGGAPSDPQGIGYLSTDFTDISKNGALNDIVAPSGGFINTKALFDAALASPGGGFLTPTVKNITNGLTHPNKNFSTNPLPPAKALATNPLNWVPSIQEVTAGYPIVGYTTWELAQCYADPNVSGGLVGFLTGRFSGQAAYTTVINNNGFTLPSAAYNKAIIATFLTASSKLAIASAGTSGTCASVTGR